MTKPAIHVVLVEDNPGDARFIRRLLADASDIQSDGQAFDLTCVDTLASGLDRLLTQPSDAASFAPLAARQPGISGTLTSVQAAAPALPIVVLTGLADSDAALAAMQYGAQDYLVGKRVDYYASVQSRSAMRVGTQAVAGRAALLHCQPGSRTPNWTPLRTPWRTTSRTMSSPWSATSKCCLTTTNPTWTQTI